jgi:hypothetical protein
MIAPSHITRCRVLCTRVSAAGHPPPPNADARRAAVREIHVGAAVVRLERDVHRGAKTMAHTILDGVFRPGFGRVHLQGLKGRFMRLR